MIIVLATVGSRAEDIEALRQDIVDMQVATATEEGSISYTFAQEIADPDTIHVIEKWRSMDDLKAHFATPHMAAFQAAMAQRPGASMEVKLYEVAQELDFPAL